MRELNKFDDELSSMATEGSYLTDRPGVADHLDEIQQRWASVARELATGASLADDAVTAWTQHDQCAARIQEFLDSLTRDAKEGADLKTMDADKLTKQLTLFKVRGLIIILLLLKSNFRIMTSNFL